MSSFESNPIVKIALLSSFDNFLMARFQRSLTGAASCDSLLVTDDLIALSVGSSKRGSNVVVNAILEVVEADADAQVLLEEPLNTRLILSLLPITNLLGVATW